MADLKLGLEGAEVTLPKISGISGYPSIPVNYEKKIEEKVMSDGSKRWGFYAKKRRWVISFGFLTWANVVAIRTLYDQNKILRFKNEYEEDVWYNVIFFSFNYETEPIPEWDKYKVTIDLREA